MNVRDDETAPQACLLSIAVCTHNRASLLDLCLDHLTRQTAPSSSFEVIVVDNNSTDDTKEIVSRYTGSHRNIRYVIELNQGLSHARNRGFREAVADYVAYVDDDAKAQGDWVARALEIIRNHQPDIFGGPIYPFYLTPKPEWFEDKYEIRIHQENTGWFPRGSPGFISGSNICLRKSLLLEYGGFNPKLGMAGTEIGYGEETEIVERALKEDRRIFYSHDLRVNHLVPEHKMRLWFHIYSNYKRGKDNARRRGLQYDLEEIFELPALIDDLLKGVNDFINAREERSVRYLEQLVVEEYAKRIVEIGRRVGFMLKADETAEIRSMLKRPPGKATIGLGEWLALNVKLLRRTRAAKVLIGWVRGHGRTCEE